MRLCKYVLTVRRELIRGLSALVHGVETRDSDSFVVTTFAKRQRGSVLDARYRHAELFAVDQFENMRLYLCRTPGMKDLKRLELV